MFSSFFSAFGGAVGKFLGGGILSSTSRFIGRWFGEILDDLESDDPSEYYLIGRTNDRLFPISEAEGKPIPLVFGKTRVEGQLICSSTIREVPIKHSSVKYFSSSKAIYNNTEFFYYCDFAIAICEGPINLLERMWISGEVKDLSLYKHVLYYGTEDQVPDSLIKNSQPPQHCPAYKGLAYIVFQDFPLIDYNTSVRDKGIV